MAHGEDLILHLLSKPKYPNLEDPWLWRTEKDLNPRHDGLGPPALNQTELPVLLY